MIRRQGRTRAGIGRGYALPAVADVTSSIAVFGSQVLTSSAGSGTKATAFGTTLPLSALIAFCSGLQRAGRLLIAFAHQAVRRSFLVGRGQQPQQLALGIGPRDVRVRAANADRITLH